MRCHPALLVLPLVVSSCALLPQTAPASRDRAGAPPVLAPRDLEARAADPCSVLTGVQLEELGYDQPGEVSFSAAGTPTCTWTVGRSGRSAAVGASLGADLFVQSYRNRVLPEFMTLEVASLPAVQLSAGRQAYTCTTTVGVAELDAVDVTTSVESSGGRPSNDPCEDGRRVAEAVVSTLPPKQ